MLSLVIPLFNEEEVIELLFERVINSMNSITKDFEVICVDDGSKDKSLIKLIECHNKDKRFKVISLSRNFGHQAAILAGLTCSKGDFIAIIDGDLQDPPELIKSFYEKLNEGFDVVFAVRKKRKEGFVKRLCYWAYYRLLKKFADITIPLDSGDFCMMNRKVLNQILQMPEQSLFIRGLRSWVGYKQTEIEYERDARVAGLPKYSFKKLFNLAYNGFFSFSHFPIKFLTKTGFIIIFFSVIYIIYILIKKIFFGGVPEGFTTIIVFIILFSGVQLLATGLVGEYLLRIYDESRKRPLFIINEKFLD
ncbi:MAG: glycosyltransferase family 2 protein [Bacteroidales bacterium]|nr:glycosyltransferase family 2 protein [Bacteroidales bacterium]